MPPERDLRLPLACLPYRPSKSDHEKQECCDETPNRRALREDCSEDPMPHREGHEGECRETQARGKYAAPKGGIANLFPIAHATQNSSVVSQAMARLAGPESVNVPRAIYYKARSAEVSLG